jgi:hypothetical protein
MPVYNSLMGAMRQTLDTSRMAKHDSDRIIAHPYFSILNKWADILRS